MNTAVFSRRRAERLARLLDEAGDHGRHHARAVADAEMARMVVIGQRLTAMPITAGPDPEFRTGLRAALIARAQRDGIGTADEAPEPVRSSAPASRWRSSRTRGAVLVGVAAGAIALSGMSTASNGAVPGDPLYGVKRSAEKAQLAFAGSDVSRGQLYLEFARTRLTEARAVRQDPAQLASVLSDMNSETRMGVKLLTTAAVDRREAAPLDAIDRFARAQRADLEDMTRTLATSMVGATLGSLNLLNQVEARVIALRASLDCTGARDARSDGLGPLPEACQRDGASGSQAATSISPSPTRASTSKHPLAPSASASASTPPSPSPPAEETASTLPDLSANASAPPTTPSEPGTATS